MPDNQKQLDIIFNVTDKGTSEKTAAQVKKAVKDAGAASGGGSPSGIKALKARAGEDSELGQIAKTIRGAGAIAAYAGIAQLLGSVGVAAGEMSDKVRGGHASTSELLSGFVKGIPILGHVYEGMEGIGEAITGVKHDLKQANLVGELLDIASAASRIADAGIRKSLIAASDISPIVKQAKLAREAAEQEYDSGGTSQAMKALREKRGQLDVDDVGGRAAVDLQTSSLEAKRRRQRQIELDRISKEEQRALNEENIKQSEGQARRVGGLQSDLLSGALSAAGRDADAQLEQIRQKYRQLNDAVDDERRQSTLADPSGAGKFLARAQEQYRQLDQNQAAEEARNRRDRNQKIADETFAHEATIQQVHAESWAMHLQVLGHSTDAELVTLRDNYDRQQQAIEKAAADRIAKLREVTGSEVEIERVGAQAKEQVAALAEKQAVEVRQKRINENKRLADSVIGAGQTIDQAKIGLLQQQAALGDAIADREAQRLQIVTQTQGQIEGITKLLRDNKDLTEDQRQQAKDTIIGLKTQEAIQLALLNGAGNQIGSRATLNSSTYLQGNRDTKDFQQSSLKAIADAVIRQIKAQEDGNGYLKQLVEQRQDLQDEPGIFGQG